MKIGIVGLGIIGGSLAQAYHRAGDTVLGFDHDPTIDEFVKIAGSVSGELTEENINDCDAVFLAIPPEAAVDWLEKHADLLDQSTLVIDCCGVKRKVCETGFRLAREKKIRFVGGHPMGGKQNWGYKSSTADMFDNCTFIIVPPDRNDIVMMMNVKSILVRAGFTTFTVMSPDEHDDVIAYTSQLVHVVANSFVKIQNVTPDESVAIGGSFRDMTRVAFLNEKIWSELFIENRDKLSDKIRKLIDELKKFEAVLVLGDRDGVKEILGRGVEAKVEGMKMVEERLGK